METNYNFQEIWNSKKTEVPNIDEIKSKADQYRKKELLITIRRLLSLTVTAIVMIIIWNTIDFKMFTTRLGIILLLVALGLYIGLFSQNFNVIRKINPSINIQEYLASLKKLQQQQVYMQTKGIGIYYLIISIGFVFYFYEFASKMSWFGAVLTYGLTFIWFAVSWFFIRPRQIKKQKEKISVVISSLEKLEKSFEE
ncbi:hypothetical protein GCM10023210_22110 [Chryseobacterium ginsengisoli]|uniref:Uncharacterized protein n=1 Tax=Chryseobacterium ginsengisoli TaxID=363853 RepID=A0ABP9M870_9FLAO